MMEKAVETDADVVRGVVRRTRADSGEERLFYRSAEDSFMTKLIGFQGAIYRTAMLQEHNIKLGPYRLGDDMCFMSQVVRYAKNVQYIDTITYEYIIRPSTSKEASAIQNNNKNFPHYYDDFLWRNWVLDYVDSHADMKEKYGSELGVFCKVIDASWLDYTKEEREKCFVELKRMVELIDWSRQNVNPKGYLQIEVEKLKGMDESAFTAYLKRQYRFIQPLKAVVKKTLGNIRRG
jgi:hypothetical protein